MPYCSTDLPRPTAADTNCQMADADLSLRDDVERYAHKTEKDSDQSSPIRTDADVGTVEQHGGFFSAFTLHSFKRNRNARMVTEATDLEGRPLPDQPPAEPAYVSLRCYCGVGALETWLKSCGSGPS